MIPAHADPPENEGAPTAGLPWHDAGEPRSSFPPDLLLRGAPAAARGLLGARLRSTLNGVTCEGVIVETEAYLGPEDPASHAATVRVTDRNRIMFGPAGVAYVYRSYGVHWCLNVVTGREGEGEAVLIRGIEALTGIEAMRGRRKGREPLGAGPGRLTQALGIDGSLDGHPLDRPPLQILPGWTVEDHRITITGRVGISKVPEWPLRFFVTSSPGVSRASAHPGDPGTLPSRPEP